MAALLVPGRAALAARLETSQNASAQSGASVSPGAEEQGMIMLFH